MATHDTDSLDTQIIEIEGPSDPNPPPVSEATLRRWEALRELYRQAGHDISGASGPGSAPDNFTRT